MSLYDGYRLSNSTVVPQFTGTAAPEMLQVGQQLQGMYDFAKSTGEGTADASMNVKGLDGTTDVQLANELRTNVLGKVKEFAAAKDWENHVPDVTRMARDFAQRSMELQRPIQQYGEYQKSLEDDKLKLTPEQKMVLLARSKAGYSGLRKDNLGRYTGDFRGVDPANNVDIPKWLDEHIKDIKPFKDASKIERSGNDGYLVTTGNKREYVSKDRVRSLLSSAFKLSPEVQSYMDMEGENAGFIASRSKVANLPDTIKEPIQVPVKNKKGVITGYKVTGSRDIPNPTKAAVMQLSAQYGVTPEQAYGEIMKTSRVSQIMDEAGNYVDQKYVYHDTEHEKGLATDEPWLQAQKDAKDDFRIAGPSANTIPDWATDPTKLTEDIKTGEDGLDRLREEQAVVERQLKADPRSTLLQTRLDRLNQTISQNERQLESTKTIWNNTRDQAVKDMKLDNGKGDFISKFSDLKTAQSTLLKGAGAEKLPATIKATDGTTISRDQLVSLMSDGKVTRNSAGSGTGTLGGGGTGKDYYTVKINGKTVELQSSDFDKVTSVFRAAGDVTRKIDQVEQKAHSIHKDVSKNFSVTANSIGLDQVEQNAVGDFGVSSATIYETPGSNKVNTDSDIKAMRFVPQRYNVETGRWTGQFKDAKGKLTEPMDVVMDTNAASELRYRLAKKNADGKWNTIIASMDDASYSGPLAKVKPGTVLTGIPDRNGIPTNKKLSWNGKDMELVLDAQDNVREWVLRYKGGDVVTDAQGNQYRTANISDADRWLQNLSK